MADVNNLKIYGIAKEIELDIRNLTKKFPAEERYCLVTQLRKAANSVGANIAEGAGRETKPDFRRFLANSRGSLKEIMHHLEISKSDKIITEMDFINLSSKIDQLGKMLTGFIKKTR